jgi:hypothetical protein
MRAIPLTFDRLPRYALLLVMMLVEIVLAPMLIAGRAGMIMARVTTGALLIAALWSVGATRINLIGFSVAVVALLTATLSSNPTLVVIDYMLRALFVGYVAGTILWHVVRQEQVTLDTIAGAACVYMLIGLAFAPAYLLIEKVHPGAFDIPDAWRIGANGDIGPAMVYFSFITLTTVGFGDIKPAGPIAGGLVIVEALIGPLFLAITVARLVGLHVSSRHD